jgi:hypothetical protein
MFVCTHRVSRARRFGKIAALETAALIAGELEPIEAVSFGAEVSPAECGCQALGVNLPMLIETVLSCDDESAIAVDVGYLPGVKEYRPLATKHLRRRLSPTPGTRWSRPALVSSNLLNETSTYGRNVLVIHCENVPACGADRAC